MAMNWAPWPEEEARAATAFEGRNALLKDVDGGLQHVSMASSMCKYGRWSPFSDP